MELFAHANVEITSQFILTRLLTDWDARGKNKEKHIEGGKIDAGTRGEVTGGSQMGAMEVLVADILCEAGLNKLDIRTRTTGTAGVLPIREEVGSHRRIRGAARHCHGVQIAGWPVLWQQLQ